MATDQSPTRNRLILTIAISTLVTLVGLKFVFDSYFIDMMESEARAKIATPDELQKLRADERQKLTGSALPIDRAMHDLALKGREGAPLITPEPSSDDAPLVGWAQGERAKAASAAAATDGGAATASPTLNAPAADGGATATVAGDAGSTVTTGDAGATGGLRREGAVDRPPTTPSPGGGNGGGRGAGAGNGGGAGNGADAGHT